MCLSVLKTSAASALIGLFLSFPLSSLATTLFFNPSGGTYRNGENFNVGVFISSDTSVNAFSSVIAFPTDTLEAIGVSQSNSIVNLWTQNPSFSNAGGVGNVRFEGVVLNPGFIGPNGRILTVTFRVKKEGSANLAFSEYAVLANDGFGTAINANGLGAHFTFLPGRSLPKAASDAAPRESVIDDKILDIWGLLPNWIKIGVLSLVGLATILLLLLIGSLGIVVLFWVWGRRRERGAQIVRWLGVLGRFVKRIFRAVPALLGSVFKEVRLDLKYGARELETDMREASGRASLSRVLGDFWGSVKRIIRRFFTKNT